MIKIKEIKCSDYQYLNDNIICITFNGRINVNDFIPELIKIMEKWENKDADN